VVQIPPETLKFYLGVIPPAEKSNGRQTGS